MPRKKDTVFKAGMAATGPTAFAPAPEVGAGSSVYQTVSRQLSGRATSINHNGRYSPAFDNSDEDAGSDKADDDAVSEKAEVSKAECWAMLGDVQDFQDQNEKDNLGARKLGVTWKDLSVYGVSADVAVHDNFFSQFDVVSKMKASRRKAGMKTIIENSYGCVKPGEMLLVLGRPGAGCTTLLNLLANRRAGFSKVEGDVMFGTLTSEEAEQYRGQIVMNTEEEIFFPTLTVGQTMDFASRLKVPFHLPSNQSSPEEYRTQFKNFLLRSMGISHTANTKVGDQYVRGVSGGERKRVSIIETLATRGSVMSWDQSTRGLDASTALEYTRCIRALTDVVGLASVVSLYQAGNAIYELFDKVLLLDEGKQIFYGPLKDAKPYMESLGFICTDGGNVADFLTGVTVPTERQVLPEKEASFPRTAVAIRETFEQSSIYAAMQTDSQYPDSEEAHKNTDAFQQVIQYEKHKSLSKSSPFTTSFMTQVKACVTRQYQMIWGDKATFAIKQGSTLVQALIVGSLFYNAPNTSSGLFIKSGALFFSLLFHSLLAMSEVTDSFTGRPVLAKHKAFAYHHPAAWCLAQIAADIPILVFQVSIFAVVLYFMVHLTFTAGAFFTYWLIVFMTTMAMTALFRAIGAAFPNFDAASKASGTIINALITYQGYLLRKGENFFGAFPCLVFPASVPLPPPPTPHTTSFLKAVLT